MPHKLTKDEITAKFRAGEISADDLLRLMADANRKPPRFAVAEKSGWLSIYFDGLRFPVSMPYECAVALFSDEQVVAARAYLEANKGRFKVKNKGN